MLYGLSKRLKLSLYRLPASRYRLVVPARTLELFWLLHPQAQVDLTP
jgi:hypothetical protein